MALRVVLSATKPCFYGSSSSTTVCNMLLQCTRVHAPGKAAVLCCAVLLCCRHRRMLLPEHLYALQRQQDTAAWMKHLVFVPCCRHRRTLPLPAAAPPLPRPSPMPFRHRHCSPARISCRLTCSRPLASTPALCLPQALEDMVLGLRLLAGHGLATSSKVQVRGCRLSQGLDPSLSNPHSTHRLMRGVT